MYGTILHAILECGNDPRIRSEPAFFFHRSPSLFVGQLLQIFCR